MSFMDKIKKVAEQAEEAAAEHKDQVKDALEKAGDFADKQTGGKYHDKIEQAESKASDAVDKLKPADGGQPQGV